MNDKSLVSIITAVYNAELYISETIESVIAQDYLNWELIVVDDHSTDMSLSMAKKYEKDSRIHVYQLPTKSPSMAAGTRNFGIDLAKGKYITFLDGDDTWNPNFLSSQLHFMKEKGCSFAFSSFFWRAANKDKNFIVPEKVTYKDILKTNSITCLTAIYDRDAIGVFYMPEEAYKREDFGCFLSILKKVQYAYGNPEVLAMYRLHGNSASSKKQKMIKWQWRVYRRVEHINFFSSVYYLSCWAINGLKKHGDLRRQTADPKR